MRDDEPGFSAYTTAKGQLFADLIRAELSVIRNVMARYRAWAYQRAIIVDATSGPGYDATGAPGLVTIAILVAREMAVPIDVWAFERNLKTAKELRAAIGGAGVRVIAADFRDEAHLVADHYHRLGIEGAFGVVLHDPNGEQLPVPALRVCTDGVLSRLDLILHIAFNAAYKRRYWQTGGRAAEDIEALGKQDRRISRPQTGHQFAFMVATNYYRLPVLKNLGLVRLDSPEGQARWHKLTMTEAERRQEAQPALPFLWPGDPTEPTPSISDTPPIEPSEPSPSDEPAAGASAADDSPPPKPIT